LQTGMIVNGTVTSVDKRFGVFFDIGAEKQALCYTNQLDKSLDQYKEGDTVTDLRIFKLNKEKGQVEVTTRSLSSTLKVGDKLEGTVATITKGGVFFDAGYASDVLATKQMLSKPIEDYTRGEVADLIVMNVTGDRVTVSTKSEEEIGTPLAKLVRGAEVTGKVVSVNAGMGVFVDIGAEKEALWRIRGLGASEEYKPGTEVTGLIISKLDLDTQTLEVASPESMPSASNSLSTLKVGQTVTGTVSRAMDFGVFVDIGAERDALYAINQLEKPASEYRPGDVIEGLKVTEVDTKRQRLAVSMKKCATYFAVGDTVDGKVTKTMTFGVFIDIGASVEAMAPARSLNKEPGEYAKGEELSGLKISQLDVTNNRISVALVEGDAGSGKDRLTLPDLNVGDKIKAIVRSPREYGVFVDIGLGRKDALLPMAMMGEETPDAFKPNDEIEVYIADVNEESDRVTVSLIKITDQMKSRSSNQRSAAARGSGYIPEGMQIPDRRMHARLMGDHRWLSSDLPPWDEWLKKYPQVFKVPEKEIELPIFSKGTNGFHGYLEVMPAHKVYIEVPKHLRKDDAAEPQIPHENDIEDKPMWGWDTGIKPEIHIKYRQCPLNDPNWVANPKMAATSDGTPTPAMSFREVASQMRPWIPDYIRKEMQEKAEAEAAALEKEKAEGDGGDDAGEDDAGEE